METQYFGNKLQLHTGLLGSENR